MSVDRYTKVVLTVIAVCLVWLSLGGPSLIAPVSAQADDERVILAGWVDEKGTVVAFPRVPTMGVKDGFSYKQVPRTDWPLPITETIK